MHLTQSPDDIIRDLFRGLIEHGVDHKLPIKEIQTALFNASLIASESEIQELVDAVIEHRTTCPDCKDHYNEDGSDPDMYREGNVVSIETSRRHH